MWQVSVSVSLTGDGTVVPMVVVYVHGAGRAGTDGWPLQAAQREPSWVFLERAPSGDHAARDAERILDELRATGPGQVVATSYGANAAVIAAQRCPELVRSLALFEPACFDFARGKPAVEVHIAAMDPVYAVADDPDVPTREFSVRFASAMGTEPPDLPDDELEEVVVRLRRLRPPWHTGISRDVGIPVPTLVITGGWSALYDQTAEAMVALGVERAELPGAGHTAHKDPRASTLLRRFWARVGAPPDGTVDLGDAS
jgi:pimeloyl-ACP methyl ester carboxylesterase